MWDGTLYDSQVEVGIQSSDCGSTPCGDKVTIAQGGFHVGRETRLTSIPESIKVIVLIISIYISQSCEIVGDDDLSGQTEVGSGIE